jgi:hypothetical protein
MVHKLSESKIGVFIMLGQVVLYIKLPLRKRVKSKIGVFVMLGQVVL